MGYTHSCSIPKEEPHAQHIRQTYACARHAPADGLALCGACYALAAAFLAGRFMRKANCAPSAYPSVTIFKPLHLGEPGLSDNLESFFSQDYSGAIQIVRSEEHT